MTVFISYARANQTAAEQLRDDVERCHRDVWLDQELTGGQSWWQAILRHIRECDVFLVVLSSEWIQSTACDLELRYALALGRPVLPVMVTKIDPRLAPPAIVDAQIVDYRQRSPETTFALRDALDTLPTAPALPEPLPPEPSAPISYLHNIIVMLNAPTLDPRHQFELWRNLRSVLDEADGDEKAELLKLVRRFRKRRDLLPALYSEIDAALGVRPPPPPPVVTRTSPQLVPQRQVWDAPTQRMPLIRPAQAPARSYGCSVKIAVGAFILLVPVAIWIGVGAAKQPPQDVAASPPASSEFPITPPNAPVGTTKPMTTKRSPKPTTSPQVTTFTMPNLVGMTVRRAEETLRPNWTGRFTIVARPTTDPSVADLIVEQELPAGTEVNKDATIKILVGKLQTSANAPAG